MAKENSRDKSEKREKREKKVSEDKVKKPKKEKKSKKATPDSNEDMESSGGAPLNDNMEVDVVDEEPVKKSKKDKKDKKAEAADPEKEQRRKEKEQKRQKKVLKEARKATEEAEAEAKRQEQAKAEAEADSDSDSSGSDSDSNEAGAPLQLSLKPTHSFITTAKAPVAVDSKLFTIDTKPAAVQPAAVKSESDSSDSNSDADSDSDGDHAIKPGNEGPAKTAPPTGLNRAARRRLMLIGRQRETIRKSLGIAPGSNERQDELETALAEWTQKLDDKMSLPSSQREIGARIHDIDKEAIADSFLHSDIREEKKRRRKAKEAQRLRSRKGKLLTGRRLKERQKQIVKTEKKAAKKAAKISSG